MSCPLLTIILILTINENNEDSTSNSHLHHFLLLLLSTWPQPLPKKKTPSSPLDFPIIGSLLELGPKPHESLAKLSHKHGPFMTIKLGTITSVIASTPDAAKDVLQRNDGACSGRTMPDVATALDHHEAGILWMPPDKTWRHWRAIRKALNIYLTNQRNFIRIWPFAITWSKGC
ncbi:putative geraniol 8-hydroxylase [Helianthus anomalus]